MARIREYVRGGATGRADTRKAGNASRLAAKARVISTSYTARRVAGAHAHADTRADAVAQILEGMLAAPQWAALGAAWDAEKRAAVNLVWHQLDGTLSSPSFQRAL